MSRDDEDGGLPPTTGELYEDLEGMASTANSETRTAIRHLEALVSEADDRGLIDTGVRRLDKSDAAEAFVGSVIFASPLLVEDGVFEIADHLFGYSVEGVPVFLLANTLFVVLMTYALLEWTGRNRTETHKLVGVVPTRLVMVLSVSFVVATLLMTVWGRVGDWQPPTEALARITVIWTVGSLGAALGDIVSGDDTSPVVPSPAEIQSRLPADEELPELPALRATDAESRADLSDGALVSAIHDQFESLGEAATSREERRDVERIRERTSEAALGQVFGDRIQKYTTRDIAEAFVGSIFFSIPFLVEDGVFDVAVYFLSFRIGQFPVFFLMNTVFVLLMVTMLVYWAGPQDVVVSRPILGVIPRRTVGIGAVSFLTAAALMTMYGRVEYWHDPVMAVARVSVVWTVASFGAALGDILPGESSGDDINDELADFGEQVEDLVE